MSCKKMIPLYPVRYAVKGKAGPLGYAAQSTLEKTFPKLQKASYTLQTIEEDFYILIVENYGGNSVFRLFQNSSERKGFVEVDWKKYSKEPNTKPVYKGGSKSYIPINHQTTKLHIGLSEYPITPSMAKKLTGAYKNKVMLQEVPVSSWSKSSPSPHTFHVDELSDVLEEFINEGNILLHEKQPTFKVAPPRQISSDMKIEYTPEQIEDPEKDKRIVIALHDPVGIAEDLNGFHGIHQQEMQKYVEKEGHRYTSGRLVSDYINSVTPNQVDIENRITVATEKARKQGGHQGRGIKLRAQRENAKLFEPLQDAYKVLQGGKGTLTNIVQHRNKYEAEIKSFEPDILASASDALIWGKMIEEGQAVDKHLAIHDHECARSWQHYEKQVSNCLNSHLNSKQGEAFVFKLVEAKPENSPLWKALAKGDKSLWDDLLNATKSDSALAMGVELVTKLSEFGVQDETALLSAILKPYLTKNLGKTDFYLTKYNVILQHRAGFTLKKHTISGAAAYNLAVDYIHDGKGLTGTNAKIHNEALSKLVKSITTGTTTEYVPLYTLEKIGEINHTKYTPLKAPSLGKDNPFRKFSEGRVLGSLGNLVTVAGAISAGVSLEKAATALGTGDRTKNEFVVLFSAISSFASASISFGGMIDTFAKTHNGYDKTLIQVSQKGFIKWAGIFGAVSSAFSAVSDGMKAGELIELGESESAGSRIAASAFNGIAAVATVAATYTAVAGTALLLGPVGWFVLAIVATGAALYYVAKSDKERISPAEFWLKHSPWGLTPRLDKHEETEVFYTAFFKPKISADWDDEFGADILTLRFYLPQYQQGKSAFEWKKAITANIEGENLNPILFEHGQAYISKPYSEVNWNKDFRIYEQIEVGNGYAVVVIAVHIHDSAKINFAYNYYPQGVESNIVLTHEKEGLNWEFADDSIWGGETIDNNRLSILSDQARREYRN